jgi:LuxR family maltose regulon positive regulatory protein
LPFAEKAQYMYQRISILALQALAFSAQGDRKQAIATLLRALELAEPGGHIRIFVNEGVPMADLLSKALELVQAGEFPGGQRASSKYIQTLLAALEHQTLVKKKAEKPRHSREKRPTLSKREREVVYLMSLGLSDREIAQKLVLTENTIKMTHSQALENQPQQRRFARTRHIMTVNCLQKKGSLVTRLLVYKGEERRPGSLPHYTGLPSTDARRLPSEQVTRLA